MITLPPELSAIRRADGREPFNGYLWPTESWWLGHERRKFDSRWHFGIVALADGRFALYGSVYAIKADKDLGGRRNCFPDRKSAIRSGAARLIQTMRASGTWGIQYGGMTGSKLAEAINWVLATVARDT